MKNTSYNTDSSNEQKLDQQSQTSGLGLRIAQVAEAVGGKKKLSEIIEISEAHLYRYISGKSQPTVGPLLAIAKAANVSMDWLVTGTLHPLSNQIPNTNPSQKNTRGNKQRVAVKGYPEIDALMLLTTLQLLEEYTQTQGLHLRPGVLHDLLLAVCKQHVDRMRANSGIFAPQHMDIESFKETIQLAM
ncbi:helix-turn-helix domain-containing protein [Magnetococcus sp. PR-3]|uniref:helix-turn-helix domain-containing protein n=1 Tax=Magnetococcus sp. PR-3 TaxID=3120355 RepID=UPI002FCE03EE